MAEELAHEDVALAVRAEVRPVLHHRRIQVDQTLLHLDEDREGRHHLGHRPDLGQGVTGPGHPRSGLAAPEVDDELAVVDHRDARTRVDAVAQVGLQQVPERAEGLAGCSVDARRLSHGVTVEPVLDRRNGSQQSGRRTLTG